MTEQETPTTDATTEGPASPEAPAPPTETPPAERKPAVSAPPRDAPPGGWWWGTGRRKTSVARVRLRPGKGEFFVNKRPVAEYFHGDRDRKDLNTVLEKTRTENALEVHVNVRGGGCTGQAGAIVLGLARALKRYDASLEPMLRDNNFLTRDPREVERKKYGQPGARRRFQFSKR